MVMPGWKTMVFFAIMAIVIGIKQFAGVEIPQDIADKLSQDQIDTLLGHGQYIYDWILIVGGFFFRLITNSAVFKKQ